MISNCNRFSVTVASVTLEKEPTVLQRIEIRFQHASEKGSKSVSRSNCVANNEHHLLFRLSLFQPDSMANYRGTIRRISDSGNSSDVTAGHIFWLSAKTNCNKSLVDDPDLNDGCFNHPVLVLTANCDLQMAVVLPVN